MAPTTIRYSFQKLALHAGLVFFSVAVSSCGAGDASQSNPPVGPNPSPSPISNSAANTEAAPVSNQESQPAPTNQPEEPEQPDENEPPPEETDPTTGDVHHALLKAAQDRYDDLDIKLRQRLHDDEKLTLKGEADFSTSNTLTELEELARTTLVTSLEALDEHRTWVREQRIDIESALHKAEEQQWIKATDEKADVYEILIFKPKGDGTTFQGKDEYGDQWVVVETTSQAPEKYDQIDRYQSLSGRFKRSGTFVGTNALGAVVEHPRYIDPPTIEKELAEDLTRRRDELTAVADKQIKAAFGEATGPIAEKFTAMLDRAMKIVQADATQALASALELLREKPAALRGGGFAVTVDAIKDQRGVVRALADAKSAGIEGIEAHITFSRESLTETLKAQNKILQDFCTALDLPDHPLAEGHDLLGVAERFKTVTRLTQVEDAIAELEPEWRTEVIEPIDARIESLAGATATGVIVKNTHVGCLYEHEGKLFCVSINDAVKHIRFSLFDDETETAFVKATVGPHTKNLMTSNGQSLNVSMTVQAGFLVCQFPAEGEQIIVSGDCAKVVLRAKATAKLVFGDGGVAMFEPTFAGSKKHLMKFFDDGGDTVVSAYSVTSWERTKDKLYVVDGAAGMETIYVLDLKKGEQIEKYAAPRTKDEEQAAKKKGRRLPSAIQEAYESASGDAESKTTASPRPKIEATAVKFETPVAGASEVLEVAISGEAWEKLWIVADNVERIANEVSASSRRGKIVKIGKRVYFGERELRWCEVD